MRNNKEVGIVVVTYNRLTLLKEAIEALRLQTYPNYQIIVINNGSTDETPKWLSQQKDILTITQENLGGAGGFFTGIKYVAEHDFSFCWIMDDDVICQSDALEELVKAYQCKPNIGFVCSKVEGIDGSPMNVPVVDMKLTDNGYAHYYDLIENFMIKVNEATFVSVFLSTKVINEVGLPFKEYFIWGDDSEYTTRIAQKYDCYLVCKSIVTHKRTLQQSLSFDTETNPQRLYFYFYLFRNRAHIYFHNDTRRNGIKYVLRLFKLMLIYALKCDFKRCSIILKAVIALASFRPIVKYPKN